MMLTTDQSRNGFTLLEVLFALAVFSIGLLAVNAMTTMVIKSNYKSRHLTTAVHLAQNKPDELTAGSYASVADATETGLDSQETAGAGIFERRVCVTASTDPEYKTVEVIISWSDPEPREAVFQTVIAP
jgi:prepilin-type N-terminal cleavage/methylation domain-containing protein